MATVAVIWEAPYTTVRSLAFLPGNAWAIPAACDATGVTVVGSMGVTNATTSFAVKWNAATLAATQLPLPPGAWDRSEAVAISQDGQTIVGNAFRSAGGTSAILWTGGGTTVQELLPPTGTTSTYVQERKEVISDDGSLVVGVVNGSPRVAIKWIHGTPTLLPIPPTGDATKPSEAWASSPDGTIILGKTYSNCPIGMYGISCYWIGTECRLFLLPRDGLSNSDPPVGAPSSQPFLFINAANTRVWGIDSYASSGSTQAGYVDDIFTGHTSSSSGFNLPTYYGYFHAVSDLPGAPSGSGQFPGIQRAAVNVTAIAATGAGVASTGYGRAVLYAGSTTPIDLGWIPQPPTFGTLSTGVDISGDGLNVCGRGNEGDFTWALWWDSAHTLHKLPTLPDATSYNKGTAVGISRDRSLIYGFIDADSIYVPPVLATLTDAELVFQPQIGFTDFTDETVRRLFVSTGGTPAWMEPDGGLPFGMTPAVYLTTLGPPTDFAQNNGSGGAFAPSGTIDAATGPGCTPYFFVEAAGPEANPQWRLTVSDDGGRTWSRLVKPRSIGALGKYLTRLRWLKMGQSRERVVKLECTDRVRNNIVGIYIDLDQGMG